MGEIIHEADLNKMDAATVFNEILKTPFSWPLYIITLGSNGAMNFGRIAEEGGELCGLATYQVEEGYESPCHMLVFGSAGELARCVVTKVGGVLRYTKPNDKKETN